MHALKDTPCWLFDLDNTLYPCTANLFDEIDRRMSRFVADFLKIEIAEAYKVQKSYFRAHGTTLKGLMDMHGMEPGELYDLRADPSETHNLWGDPGSGRLQLDLYRRLCDRMAFTVDPLPEREANY